jgi:putative transposase
MARIGRFVVPELPRHVTQRDNRRERAFFADADYELHRDLLRGPCAREGSRYEAIAWRPTTCISS